MTKRSLPCVISLLVLFVDPAPSRAQTGAPNSELLEKENIVEVQTSGKAWQPAAVGMKLAVRDRVRTDLDSRAVVRLTDLTILRLDEATDHIITAPTTPGGSPGIDLKQGGAYFFSRERAPEARIKTPAANGSLRGTQLVVRVTPGLKTLMTILEGEVELSNAQGSVTLTSGEQGEAEVGKAPRKTAVIDAVNIIQWALYYPGVLDPRELGLGVGGERAVGASLAAYQQGDLLGALEKYPPNYRPTSTAGRLYRAAVLLSVGRVDDAQKLMGGIKDGAPGKQALERMIAAVKFQDTSRTGEPRTAGEWMAESYYEQSKSRLEAARDAARKATEVAPDFGYAWVRLAELEFSYGRTPQALKALERGLELTPRNAQGHSLRGFLLSAQNKIDLARDAFNEAIAIDGALGNAWLGRGLTYIRQGKDEVGRQDLQVAATLEPNRSILHSYLGKAFSQVGDIKGARKDLARAKELDPNDPTPWLYSAIQNKQENRYNDAVTDLEKSLELNENRRVYRSQFLLDQDRAVRGTNLAAIYLNNGMVEQSVREAVRAVTTDYSSASTHLFLSNSYNALRDPRRINLRYETPWYSELLLSQLLSPVGGGPLSQFVSQQEYSKLFEADGLGISSITDYFSTGELRETASQYGTFGNFSYAFDTEYLYDTGFRPNNESSRIDAYASFKFQLGPQDTILFRTEFVELELGDVRQKYDARGSQLTGVDRSFDFRELQDPGPILVGYHHEWQPGVHTLLLLGRVVSDIVFSAEDAQTLVATRNVPPVDPAAATFNEARRQLGSLIGRGEISALGGVPYDLDYRSNLEIYTAELNQIIQHESQTFILGARYQRGRFETHVRLFSDVAESSNAINEPDIFGTPFAKQDFFVDFERINLYAYDIWEATRWLSLTAGVTYDKLSYPENFRDVPINDRDVSYDKLSPKFGMILTPRSGTTIRAAYTEFISGASVDESFRLEPTQVAGFNQSSRTLISESLSGSVAGARYRVYGLSLEQKLPTRTYLGVELTRSEQRVDRVQPLFDFLTDFSGTGAVLPSSVPQRQEYREDVLAASVNQLIGESWSLGARYRFTKSQLRTHLPTVPRDLGLETDQTGEAVLHEIGLFALYNHRTGFFARAEANWFNQENMQHPENPSLGGRDPMPGDSFWQLNAFAGYRFHRNQCEIGCGVLNITGEDYRLNPLNPYLDLPRDRTLVVRAKFSF